MGLYIAKLFGDCLVPVCMDDCIIQDYPSAKPINNISDGLFMPPPPDLNIDLELNLCEVNPPQIAEVDHTQITIDKRIWKPFESSQNIEMNIINRNSTEYIPIYSLKHSMHLPVHITDHSTNARTSSLSVLESIELSTYMEQKNPEHFELVEYEKDQDIYSNPSDKTFDYGVVPLGDTKKVDTAMESDLSISDDSILEDIIFV